MHRLTLPVPLLAGRDSQRYSRRVLVPRRVAAASLAALATSAGLAAGAAPAGAADVDKSKALWATVNRCLTSADRFAVGIRASMPGVGDPRQRMYMRFQLQYFDASAKRWKSMGGVADSGFILVGNAGFKRRESGNSFGISAPPAGGEWRLRGVVTFEWRRGKKVVERVRERTVGGHKGTSGSSPKGFSAAECTITE
jgi:hypothetical protein